MKNIIKKIAQTSKIIAIATVLSFGLSYVYAWTAPTISPPGGNTAAPINTSTTAQVKDGGLSVNAFSAFANAYIAGNLMVGTTTAPRNLEVNGDLFLTGKAVSSSTVVGDTGTTLVTKDYLDSKISTGSILDVTNSPTLTSSGLVKVDFTTENVDVYGAFNLITDEIKFPAGTYLFEFDGYGCGFLSDNSTGADQFHVRLLKNGADILLQSSTLVSQPGYNCLMPSKIGVVTVSGTDVIIMQTWHDEIATNIQSNIRVTSLGVASVPVTSLECETVSRPWSSLTYGQVVSVNGPVGYVGVSCNGDYYDNNRIIYHGYVQGSFNATRTVCSWTNNDEAIFEGSVKGDFCRIKNN